MPRRLLIQFLQLEAASGFVLLLATILALLLANLPGADVYYLAFRAHSLFWINEVLMAIFFLLVGLELKQGYYAGDFAHKQQVLLPAVAALGGMIVPAGLYVLLNVSDTVVLKGWATPVATDIAFALGVLALIGKHIPLTLKRFLLALAIFDDIGAIIIIALFYADDFSSLKLLLAVFPLLALYLCNRYKLTRLLPYLCLGIWLWYCFLQAGIHPTIAGVLLAFAIPAAENQAASPLHGLEKKLHPWVAFLIMPLFAFANAGFDLSGVTLSTLTEGVVLGIALGLFLGKQMGIMSFTGLLTYFKLAKLPEQADWLAFYGVAILCGIGFTMSLFLGTLSFQQENAIYLAEVRLGVLMGSLLSGVLGIMILLFASYRKAKKRERGRGIE